MTISLLLFLVLGSAAAADKTSLDTGDTLRVMKKSYMTMAVSRPSMDKIIKPGRGSKNVLFVNILEARKLREKETAAFIEQAVIQALKTDFYHPMFNYYY